MEEKLISDMELKMCEEDMDIFAYNFLANSTKNETPDFHIYIERDLINPEIKRLVIVAPRGHAKSTVAVFIFCLWAICFKKFKFIVIVSDTSTQAKAFLESIKSELENNVLIKQYFGNLVGEKWNENFIVTQTDIKVVIKGAGQKIRGINYKTQRPDCIICDDIQNDDMAKSKNRRDKLKSWFNSSLIPALDVNGRIIVIGTIMHYDDLLSNLSDPEKYDDWTKKKYKAIENGKPLWPDRFTMEKLEQIKKAFADAGQLYLFYQEYMNDPISDENRKFKFEKIKYYKPDDIEGLKLDVYILMDRAYSMAKTADFTGLAVVGLHKETNNLYILQSERIKADDNVIIQMIFDLRNTYYNNPNYTLKSIAIEQKALDMTLKPHLVDKMRIEGVFFEVEPLKDMGRNKNLRIEGLLPRFNLGTIFFRREFQDLIDELTLFPLAKHDDLSDALAYSLDLISNKKTYAVID